jgi:[ribosomal protein S5]-alanine N-acetyltransferase
VLRSQRLTLWPIRSQDAAAVHEYRSDPDVVGSLTHGPLDLRETQERLAEAAEHWTRADDERFNLTFAVVLDGDVIGDVHAWNTEEAFQPQPT